MYTRQERLANKCTHRQYYAQFVTGDTKQRVLSLIGNKERLVEHFKLEDEEFFHPDKIQLEAWTGFYLSPQEYSLLRSAGDFRQIVTPSTVVCLAKEAARQIVGIE